MYDCCVIFVSWEYDYCFFVFWNQIQLFNYEFNYLFCFYLVMVVFCVMIEVFDYIDIFYGIGVEYEIQYGFQLVVVVMFFNSEIGIILY